MRQRVVIALALIGEPELVIADEPTTALDVSVQAQVLSLLRKLCTERGTGVMLVTHDMGVIAETTDRTVVLYAGRVAEVGPTRDLLTRPAHPYTRGLVASTPTTSPDAAAEAASGSGSGADAGRRLYQIPGAMPGLLSVPDGCAFPPALPARDGRVPRAPAAARRDRRDGGALLAARRGARGVSASPEGRGVRYGPRRSSRCAA